LVSVRDTLWSLRGKSAVRLEGIANPTMRLAEGQLECHGAGRCLTEFGVVVGQKDSMVLMVVDDEGMDLHITEGEASFVTARGEIALQAGQSWRVDVNGTATLR